MGKFQHFEMVCYQLANYFFKKDFDDEDFVNYPI